MDIPREIWEKEPHHKEIWKNAGLCAKCQINVRESMCSICLVPMCYDCLKEHKKEVPRERYLKKIYEGKITGFTPEEEKEAFEFMSGQ